MPRRPKAELILREVAEHVRAERKRMGLTIAELAKASGLSNRFLVGLEGGTQNVSLLRLSDVATALGSNAGNLLVAARKKHVELAELGETGNTVSLVGLRGAGKSSIGRLAADRLGRPFVELDLRVSTRAGMSLGELFDLHGADYYRRLEREELERVLADEPRAIVATAGSIVTDEKTYGRLLSTTTVVWLSAKPEEHFSRVVAQGDLRPMAERNDAMRDLRGILRARGALYKKAHFVVDTSKLGLAKSVDRVVDIAEKVRANGASSARA